MARGILGQYGPDSSQPQKATATKGGCMPGDQSYVNKYQQPWGPKNIMDPQNPGLHGNKYGNTNGPDNGGKKRTGMPGLGGKVFKGGSQGSY